MSAVALQRSRLNQLRRAAPGVNRGQKAMPEAILAPVGGWNSRDALDEMKPEDAVSLDNWFPGLGQCSIRNGTIAYATTLGGTVKMISEFNAKGLRKFIAAANNNIWNISSAGAGVSLASGFSNDAWEVAQFDDASGGARSGLVNGSDAPQIYDGAVVGAMTISGTGLTPSLLNGIHIYKSRSYFWDDRTQDFWYSATNALGGALTKFPLGRVQGTGGNMLAMGTWSRDSGFGPADYAVFVLSSGDFLIYAGDNPGDPTAWALIGRYNIGAPISKRAVKKIGSELLVATVAGYIPLTKALPSGRLNEQQTAISNKISGAAGKAAVAYKNNFGWDMLHYPGASMLIVNVPVSSTQAEQHVMNTNTGAWCRFTGMNAKSWALFNDKPFYGTDAGTVVQFDSGHNDLGVAINADAQLAWNYLNSRQRTKRATAVMPLLRTTGGAVTYNIGVGFDYKAIFLSIAQSAPTIITSPWDVSPWDTTPWADDFLTSNIWSSASDSGYAISSRLRILSSTQGVDWFGMTYLLEPGGVI